MIKKNPAVQMRVAVVMSTGNTTISRDLDVASSGQHSDSELFMVAAKELAHEIQGMLRGIEPPETETAQ